MRRRRQLERALSINPDFADAHSNLGNVLLAQGRLDEAAQCYHRALALKPDLAGAHNNLGIVLAAQGRFEEASRCFQQALARKPDFIDAYNNLGARVHGARAARQCAGRAAARARDRRDGGDQVAVRSMREDVRGAARTSRISAR